MRAGQIAVIAQEVNEEQPRIDVVRVRLPVDGD
jgi:hypothetical protein